MAQRQIVAKVLGIVQGVFYRGFIAEQAELLGLVGFVENLNDGTVKIVAEGEEDKLQRLIEKAMQGPRGSHIEDVQVEWLAATGKFKNFETR